MGINKIRGEQIKDESIESVDIASGSIKAGELSQEAISDQSTIDSVDTSNDHLLIFDASSDSLKKVAPTNLGIGGGGGGTTSFLPTGSLYSLVANLSGSGAGMTTYNPAFTAGIQFIPLRKRTISGVRFWANMTSATDFKFSIWDKDQTRVLTKTVNISTTNQIHEITFDSSYTVPDENIGKPLYASFYYTEGSQYPRSDSVIYVPATPFIADQHWVVKYMGVYGSGDSFPGSNASEFYMIEPIFDTIDE
jgi:hypothetical protein